MDRAGFKWPTFEDAYWSRVVKSDTGCWHWSGNKTKFGHGQFNWRHHRMPAHRAAWMIHNQRKIAPLLVVRHKCLTKDCTKPAHLELGTYSDNGRDYWDRDRFL